MSVQSLFDRYNQRFFGAKLQGWTVDEGHLSDLPTRGRDREYGTCNAEGKEIFIQKGLSPAEKRKTLLHEMCHAIADDAGNQCHGERWQKEMFRIDKLGAGGMAAEARSYADRIKLSQAKMARLRKKPMKDYTDREKLECIYDKPSIRLETRENTSDSKFRNQLQRLRGGRPRKDSEAARADELRSQKKTWSEVQKKIDPKNLECNTADAYRKLVESRKTTRSKTGEKPPR